MKKGLCLVTAILMMGCILFAGHATAGDMPKVVSMATKPMGGAIYYISAGKRLEHAGDFLFGNITVYYLGLSGLMDLDHGFGPAHAVTPDFDQICFDLLLLDAVLKSVVSQVSTLGKAAGGCSDINAYPFAEKALVALFT